ncbi:hypothetical protein Arth_4179 (plasmid) [Arthrobacter sp. FB24]|uniref:hypothetical protein n=1 Tax=Arthrobacter sp. (strain FB24) TaxID=290399 RepID=UPI0000E5BEC2|nr:hypothetical protein [Arthrobacter sp. FB24]ABK05820.1 hypothetical protein Arth_4179 [Arthrobacter sp. FB24]
MIAAAFWILAAVFVFRLYFVARWGASTAFAGAIGIGFLGLFLTGVVVPEATIDAALGGVNFLHLVRNLCVTSAVWLVRQGIFAAYSADESYRSRLSHRPLAAGLGAIAITVPFLCQEFVPTTLSFVPENVEQMPVFVYASVYMGILALLAVSVLRICLRPQESLPVRVSSRVVAAGMALVALASVEEIAYMTALHNDVGGSALHQVLYVLFNPLFYGGVLLTSLGLGIPPVVKVWRRLQIWDRFALVFLTATLGRAYWGLSRAAWLPAVLSSFYAKHPTVRLYEYVIRSSDHKVALSGRSTPMLAGRVLDAVQARFDGGVGSLESVLSVKAPQ